MISAASSRLLPAVPSPTSPQLVPEPPQQLPSAHWDDHGLNLNFTQSSWVQFQLVPTRVTGGSSKGIRSKLPPCTIKIPFYTCTHLNLCNEAVCYVSTLCCTEALKPHIIGICFFVHVFLFVNIFSAHVYLIFL